MRLADYIVKFIEKKISTLYSLLVEVVQFFYVMLYTIQKKLNIFLIIMNKQHLLPLKVMQDQKMMLDVVLLQLDQEAQTQLRA